MAKYASGLTIDTVCKLEVKEAKGILKKYGVTKEDRENITGIIKEAYFQLKRAYESGCRFEEYVMEKSPQLYEQWIRYMLKEIGSKYGL